MDSWSPVALTAIQASLFGVRIVWFMCGWVKLRTLGKIAGTSLSQSYEQFFRSEVNRGEFGAIEMESRNQNRSKLAGALTRTQDVDYSSYSSLFQKTNPAFRSLRIFCFLGFLPVPTAHPSFDRFHVLWGKFCLLYGAAADAATELILYAEFPSSNNIVPAGDSQLAWLLSGAFILYEALLCYTCISAFTICRNGTFLCILGRFREGQIVDQSTLDEVSAARHKSVRNALSTLISVLFASVLLTSVVLLADTITGKTLPYLFFFAANSLMFVSIAFGVISLLVMLPTAISAEALCFKNVLEQCFEETQRLSSKRIHTEEASLSVNHISIEINPVFKHKHRHNFKPSSAKLATIGGADLTAVYHSYCELVYKVRFASQRLSAAVFCTIPGALFFLIRALLFYTAATSINTGIVARLVYSTFVGVFPWVLILGVYCMISVEMQPLRSTIIRSLTQFGLTVNDERAEETIGVAIETCSHLPTYFVLAGVPLTEDAFVKMCTAVISLVTAFIAFR
eukprot:ANDGO_08512.mRNA.1 hypothetical protein